MRYAIVLPVFATAAFAQSAISAASSAAASFSAAQSQLSDAESALSTAATAVPVSLELRMNPLAPLVKAVSIS